MGFAGSIIKRRKEGRERGKEREKEGGRKVFVLFLLFFRRMASMVHSSSISF